MNQVKWTKVDNMFIADYNGHIAQDTELIKAIEKAVRGGKRK